MEKQKQEILSTGCDHFVTKPFRQQELLEKIEQHLGIQFVRESDESEVAQLAFPDRISTASDGSELSAEILKNLQAMPDTWLQQLHEAAIQGDDSWVLQVLKQIPPEYDSLSKTLTNLAQHFQFETIVNAVEQVQASSS
jgi:two-component system sensor histidine kinase/response regulator